MELPRLLGVVVVCSVGVAAADPASSGLTWILSQQAADGSFGGTTGEQKVLATVEALETLRAAGQGQTPAAHSAELFLAIAPRTLDAEVELAPLNGSTVCLADEYARHAILGFADALVVQLQQRYGCDPVATIERLDVTVGQRELLLDSYQWQGFYMTARAEVERALLDEEAVLEQVACLLEAGAELASWPEGLRAALVLAVMDATMSRTEGWKAVTL